LKRILSSVLAFFGGAEAYNKSRFVLTGCKSAVNFFLLCFLFLHLRVKLETKKILGVQEKCFGVQGEAPLKILKNLFGKAYVKKKKKLSREQNGHFGSFSGPMKKLLRCRK